MLGERVPVLLLGNGVTGLGVLRSLAHAGIAAFGLADEPGPMKWSRWYRAAPGRESVARADLPRYLSALPWDQAVLMPCSDHWTLAVAALPTALRGRFPASIPPANALQAMVDKRGLALVLDSLGIPHPRTVDLSQIAALADVPGDLLSRSFLKPRDSQRFFAQYGVKAFLVRSRGDALRDLQALQRDGHRMVLQEFIPGDATHHYFVDGFARAGGEPAAIFVRQRLRMYPRSFGNSSYMVSVPATDAGPAVEQLTRLLRHVGYRGPFSAEFKRDAGDGVLKLLEVNVRPWWYVEFAARCGVNVCEMAYRDALGQAVSSVADYAVDRGCVYTSYDLHAALALRARGDLSWREWGKSWLSSMRPIYRLSDPLPAIAGSIGYVLGGLGRSLTWETPVSREWQPSSHPAV